MRKSVLLMALMAFAVGGTTACATKGFVKTQVGGVNNKVDTLSQSLEAAQERTRQNEGRIGEVDQHATAAATAASAAQSAADQAAQKALAANEAAGAAGSKADALDKASKRIVYEVVLSENQGNFKLGKTNLPDDAKAKIDELVTKLKADPKGAYFEIEGHTDNVGDKMFNEKLGLERAEAVKRYLYEQHQIPLHRMNVISYGEDKPLAPNKTKDGRAQNRAWSSAFSSSSQSSRDNPGRLEANTSSRPVSCTAVLGAACQVRRARPFFIGMWRLLRPTRSAAMASARNRGGGSADCTSRPPHPCGAASHAQVRNPRGQSHRFRAAAPRRPQQPLDGSEKRSDLATPRRPERLAGFTAWVDIRPWRTRAPGERTSHQSAGPGDRWCSTPG